jgi:hypothetical protein
VSALVAARPRPVYCAIEHEHRDHARAADVAAGRFTHAGETRVLGVDPDWLRTDLPADEEWRIEWVKFYFGLDLADAFRATGEPRFLAAWEQLVGSWILQVPADHDVADVTARRVLNWIYAWQRLPETGAAVAAALAESIGEQARHVRLNLAPERNHRTLELYALLVAGLALPDSCEPGLVDFAVAALHANLLADFRPDGVHREASTHYHLVALRSLVGARENCRRFGVALPPGFDARLSAACDFASHCRRPDGTIPALSDSDSGDYGELLALASRLLERDELRAPARGHASFPDGGYFVQRAGERFLILDCGPLGDGGHGHYDLLSIEAWAGAQPLVLDPGRFTYAEGAPNLRHWFRGTAAHNTVCVDGLDQTPYARGRSRAPSAAGRFLGRTGGAGLDVLCGEARSPLYDALHRRRIAFVDGSYWILEDRLRGDAVHRCDLRFHLAPEARGAARVLAGGTVLAPGLALVILGADALALEPGWISPRYGIRQPAPVVSAVATGRELTFVTLLAPRASGAPAPALVREPDGSLAVDGLGPRGTRDTLVLGADAVTWRRSSARGRVLCQVAV